jgi:hypothetical protein
VCPPKPVLNSLLVSVDLLVKGKTAMLQIHPGHDGMKY